METWAQQQRIEEAEAKARDVFECCQEAGLQVAFCCPPFCQGQGEGIILLRPATHVWPQIACTAKHDAFQEEFCVACFLCQASGDNALGHRHACPVYNCIKMQLPAQQNVGYVLEISLFLWLKSNPSGQAKHKARSLCVERDIITFECLARSSARNFCFQYNLSD